MLIIDLARCGAVYHFSEEVTLPSYPCYCGSRFWLKITG
ncbi:MAG: hypothetical protein BPH100C_183 [Phage 5P_2]|nr:MAG: hypothetical protein BPH100C_183 [Phage 5P_2]